MCTHVDTRKHFSEVLLEDKLELSTLFLAHIPTNNTKLYMKCDS